MRFLLDENLTDLTQPTSISTPPHEPLGQTTRPQRQQLYASSHYATHPPFTTTAMTNPSRPTPLYRVDTLPFPARRGP